MLNSGTKLGPYEILSPLGAGGMGEVYRARDTRLDRTVAVKILPPHLSEQPEARERFEREARAVSSLNHANICQLYDVGQQEGVHYLVMEYLEGETLATRLIKGPLPLEQVLRYGAEIADGLDKAHRSGVVHRDLKPGTIMLTRSGAKLMDFGLAKTAAPPKLVSHLSATLTSADVSHPLTAQGTVLGTYQYMSPEQVEGREADPRSDLFSLGAVLYEMTTGKRAFEGKSQISIASAILEKEPEAITAVLPLAPLALQHVVESCIAKDPEARWQSAADLTRELRWISSAGSRASQVLPPHPRKKFPERTFWITLATLLLATLLWTVLHRPLPAPLRTYVLPPPDAAFHFTGDLSGPPALSPDGTEVAFSARSPKERDFIWIRDLDNTTPRKLPGTEGGYDPFWSADGRTLGFFADGKLRKVAAAGGPVTALADAPNARGGCWSKDNVIVYAPDYRDGLWSVGAGGGTPRPATRVDSSRHTTHRWPVFLPDGKHFLFLATNHVGGVLAQNGTYLAALDKADGGKLILSTDSSVNYASGYLLFHQQTSLVAQKFDPATGTLSGDAVTIAGDVEYDGGTWHTTFTVSPNGLLLYEPGTAKLLHIDMTLMDRAGKVVGHLGEPDSYFGARPSPDGRRIAVALGDPKPDIWVFNVENGSRTRLTFEPSSYFMPAWSPDGQRVGFMAQNGPSGTFGSTLHARLADGSGEDELLAAPAGDPSISLTWPQWSPDGRYLLYQQQSGPAGTSVWALPTTGERKPFPVVLPQTPQSRISYFRLSPQGRWLAYSATDSGREEIYVTQFPGSAGRWQVSREGGLFPVWRRDGKELYYLGLDTQLRAVEVKTEGSNFSVGDPQTLFTIKNAFPLGAPYEAMPDGQRFLVMTPPESTASPLLLIQNWTTQLNH